MDRRLHDAFERPLALNDRDRRRGGLADDGEDRALDRLGDRAVGGLGALVEGVRKIERVELRLAGEPLGEAAQDLAGDHAGVATRAHQRPERRSGRDALRGDGRAKALGLRKGRSHRGHHVRAGVTVRDRKDVQRVDLIDARLECGRCGPERPEETRTVAGPSGHQARPGIKFVHASGDVRPTVR